MGVESTLGRGTTVVAWPDGDLTAYLESLEVLSAYLNDHLAGSAAGVRLAPTDPIDKSIPPLMMTNAAPTPRTGTWPPTRPPSTTSASATSSSTGWT